METNTTKNTTNKTNNTTSSANHSAPQQAKPLQLKKRKRKAPAGW